MWADNETKDDLLGYQVHADLLRDVVLDPKMLPISIGVFGLGFWKEFPYALNAGIH